MCAGTAGGEGAKQCVSSTAYAAQHVQLETVPLLLLEGGGKGKASVRFAKQCCLL